MTYRNKLRGLTAAAMLTAITAVTAQIMIPLPFTPIFFSLALLAVFLSGGVLPPRWAAAAQLCYLALGCFGVPVFGGFKGGPGVLLGPTGGYLAAYPIMALLIALLLRGRKRTLPRCMGAMILAMVVCYLLGTAWFCVQSGAGVAAALSACVFPFILPDLFKALAASFCVLALSRAGR